MKSKMWLVFVCVQAVGIAALRLGPDWSLILGVLLLFPGLLALYLIPDIHKLLLVKDIWLTLAALVINTAAWQGLRVSIRKLKKRG